MATAGAVELTTSGSWRPSWEDNVLRHPKRLLTTLALFSLFLATKSWAAPSLTLGSVSGQAGTLVNLAVNYDPTTSSVATLQFDMTLPASLSLTSISTGTIVTSAGKNVSQAKINSTTWRFFIGGVNLNTIAAGTL